MHIDGGCPCGAVRYEAEVDPITPFNWNKKKAMRFLSESIGDVPAGRLKVSDVMKYARDRLKKVVPTTMNTEVRYLAEALRSARALWNYPVSDQVVKDAFVIMKQHGMVAGSTQRDRRPTEEELKQDVQRAGFQLVSPQLEINCVCEDCLNAMAV